MSTPTDVAFEAWGQPLPDWIARLAAECDLTSQAKVAKRLGYSGAVVSQVLRKKYPGALGAVEETVRGVLLAAVVECPQLGEIGTMVCREWREKARAFSGHNALRVTMFRACTRCPRFRASDREASDA
jgi:hypothetical protein